MSKHQQELDRHFAWFQTKLPPGPSKFVGWVRKPSSIYARVPLAFLLIFGGIFSFLPVLGLWMLPLGLLMLAVDIPALRGPVGDVIVRLQRFIANSKRWLRARFDKTP